MYKLLCVIAIVFFSAVVKVKSLQCYECMDCTHVTNDQIVTCGAVSTTVAPTTLAPGQTTTPGQVTTPAPGQTTTTGQVTTPAPGQTTTPGQEATPAPGQTTTPGQVTTPAPEQTTTPQVTTPAPEQTTTPASEQITTPGSNTENSPQAIRQRRAVIQERAADYVCLTIKHEVNNTAVVSRGCALDAGDGKVCEVGIANVTCTSCKTDNCNSAASIQVSLILMFAVALFRFC